MINAYHEHTHTKRIMLWPGFKGSLVSVAIGIKVVGLNFPTYVLALIANSSSQAGIIISASWSCVGLLP